MMPTGVDSSLSMHLYFKYVYFRKVWRAGSEELMKIYLETLFIRNEDITGNIKQIIESLKLPPGPVSVLLFPAPSD